MPPDKCNKCRDMFVHVFLEQLEFKGETVYTVEHSMWLTNRYFIMTDNVCRLSREHLVYSVG